MSLPQSFGQSKPNITTYSDGSPAKMTLKGKFFAKTLPFFHLSNQHYSNFDLDRALIVISDNRKKIPDRC